MKLSLGNIVYCKTEDTVFHGISTSSLTFWPKWGNAYGQKGVHLKQIFRFATKKKPCPPPPLSNYKLDFVLK